MKLSSRAKALLAAGVVLGVLVFLVIVDLGVNAGRIHYGVEVAGIDVGGLTEEEAYEKLFPVGEEMAETPVVFFGDTFDCRFVPEELGWGPQAAGTAETAYGVGRDEGLLTDVVDRMKAWVGGANVKWAGKPRPRRVGKWVRECADTGAAAGVRVDKGQLRFFVKKALGTWPRPQIWDIPTET